VLGAAPVHCRDGVIVAAGDRRITSAAANGGPKKGFKPLAVTDDVSNMDLVKVDSGTEILGQFSGTLWQKTVLTSFVLAGCLALIVVLAIF